MLDKAKVYYEARTTYYSIVLIVNVVAMAALTSFAMTHFVLFLASLLVYSYGLRHALVAELTASRQHSASARHRSASDRFGPRIRWERTAVLWFSLLYTVSLTVLTLVMSTN
ncbi:hypothetical protein ACFFSY_16310 [Paenibacillus aurantiacus]|uniref:DUF3899 domain-containing protein n=1 Tax=Paenibacillus aurantiacus TaxID=1936118 RepID=A0ABV5KQJ7_9BACL